MRVYVIDLVAIYFLAGKRESLQHFSSLTARRGESRSQQTHHLVLFNDDQVFYLGSDTYIDVGLRRDDVVQQLL